MTATIDKEFLDSSSANRLSSILQHALGIPFYKERLGELQSSRSYLLSDFPTLSRAELHEASREFLGASKASRGLIATSGTTQDVASYVIRDGDAVIQGNAVFVRTMSSFGIRPGDRIAFVAALRDPSIEIALQRYNQRMLPRFQWLVCNLGEWNHSLESIRTFSPRAVMASPRALLALSDEVLAHRLLPGFVSISINDRLHASVRNAVSEATGEDVFDVYSAREFSTVLGFDCQQHQGFHVNSDYLIVELIGEDGSAVLPGEPGEVVVTDLCNWVFPIIRLKTGDLAVEEGPPKCECGSALPLKIGAILGRTRQRILLSNGATVPAGPVVAALLEKLHVPLTLKQESDSNFVVFVYPVSSGDASDAFIAQTLEACLGDRVNVRVETRDRTEFSCVPTDKWVDFVGVGQAAHDLR